MNDEDMKERLNNFHDDDTEMQPLVLSETYTELFENRKPAKDRKPLPSMNPSSLMKIR